MKKPIKTALQGTVLYKYSCPQDLFIKLRDYSNAIEWDKVPKRNKIENSGRSFLPNGMTSLHMCDELNDLHEWVTFCINQAKDEIGWNQQVNLNLKISQSWLNASFTGELHHHHIHQLSLLSSILYIQGEAETSFWEKSSYSLPSVLSAIPQLESIFKVQKVKSQVGNLIVFPSNLRHSVDKNLGTENRITFSANSWFDGQYGTPEGLVYISK